MTTESSERAVVALTFDGTNCHYDGPAQVEEGTVDFRFINASDKPFAVAASSVEDYALTDFLREGEVGTDWDIPTGHPRAYGLDFHNRWPLVPAGESQAFGWLLPAGTYYLECVLALDHVWRTATLEVVDRTAEAVTATTKAAPTPPRVATGATSSAVPPEAPVTTNPESEEARPPGAAGDQPEEFLAGIQSLIDSAGPGRMVGFVSLSDDASTEPATHQPYCTGAGAFSDIAPGVAVTVVANTEPEPAVAMLRGSALDTEIGCGLWFGVEVAEADSYTITIGDHSAMFEAADLAAHGWIGHLWSNQRVMEAICEEATAYEQTCSLSAVLEKAG